jgi:hypothetical protein
MKIVCSTLFDITATGVTGHFKPSRVPFKDNYGQEIANESQWHRARNQQRNWETLSQLISLRTQVFDASKPVVDNGTWTFEFEVETPEVFADGINELGLLLVDCNDVPMLTGLDETNTQSRSLNSLGPDQNITFVIQ